MASVLKSAVVPDDLQTLLAKRIRQQGALRFDEYMEQALYAPKFGYYECAEPVFGEKGDFVTAPGLGDLFARCVARFCSEVLTVLPGGAIAEYGPGNGDLAQKVLGRLDSPPSTYWMIERSTRLRHLHPQEVHHADTLPKGFEGVVLANEFLDALPARCFEVTDTGVCERMVSVHQESDELCWTLRDSKTIQNAAEKIFSEVGYRPPIGYRSEWRHEAYVHWLQELDRSMQRGLVLILDYGYPRREYYHPQRSDGTLRCHIAHQAHEDPLQRPGHQDISIDVEFSSLAELATEAGFDVMLFTSQAGFLLEYGLLEAMEPPSSPVEHLQQLGEVDTLTSPDKMGERFRALVLGRDYPAGLETTVCPDHLNRL